MRTKFEDAANINDDVEQDNSIHHLHNPPPPPPPPHYHHQTKASLRPARSRKGTCGARIYFRWVHIGHFSKNGLIENTHTFCGKIQEVSLNVWRNTMDSKGQICEKIMFVSICGVGRTQTMASCNGSCSLGRMTPQPKQAQRQREKELIFRGSRYDFLEKELIFRKLE